MSDPSGTMGPMSSPAPAPPDRDALCARADELLSALAGPGARLREDQARGHGISEGAEWHLLHFEKYPQSQRAESNSAPDAKAAIGNL